MAPSRHLPADCFTLLSLFSTHARPSSEEPPFDHPLHSRRFPTRVFVLGVNERRVTVYSQQCRAFNLIWLLHKTGVLESPGESGVAESAGRVAVVGAGAAGLTAAAAAACKGHGVLLLNKSLDAMPQQRFARHRWLHPRIFDWPTGEWWKKDAELPFLNWIADDAHSVRRTILDDFDEQPWRGRIEYLEGADGVKLAPARRGAPRPTVSWVRKGEERSEEVGVVVLAVGFGSDGSDEFVRPPVYRDSYWDDPSGRWTSPGCALISGGGDGGLTEVLHAVFGEEFDHDRIVELAGCPKKKPEKWVGDVANRIEAFEERWRHRQRPPATDAGSTMEFFRDHLEAPEVEERLERLRREGKRTAAREVILVVKDDDFAVTSCALNRFLVARLKQVRVEFASLETNEALTKSTGPYHPTLQPIAGGAPIMPKVDSIVVRHGTGCPPLKAFEKWVVPDVQRTDFGGTAAALLDASRDQHWPKDFYAACGEANGRPSKTPEQEVLLPRAEAAHSLSNEPQEADDPTRIVLGALEAAAMAGLALTQSAVERIARVSPTAASDIVARLFGADTVSPGDGLTVANEHLGRRREQLPVERETDATAGHRGPAAHLTALGHLRAGALLGAWVSDTGTSGDHPDRILSTLRQEALPWWTAHGYATARYDHAPTQLGFGGQLISVARGREAPADVWETGYTALRRAMRCLRHDAEEGDPDRELWAEALVTASELMAGGGEDERANTVAAELEKRWDMSSNDRAFVAGLFALRALDPSWPGWWQHFFLALTGGQVAAPKPLRPDRLARLADVVQPEAAAEVLRQLGDASTPSLPWSAVLRAERQARELSPLAADHVGWVVDGK